MLPVGRHPWHIAEREFARLPCLLNTAQMYVKVTVAIQLVF